MAALWKAHLKSALDVAESEGATFAVTGVDSAPLPQVAVRGVGKLVFPIDAEQGEDLVFAGMPAPYGKGARTELNPAVRKATQLDPGRVRFSADWDATLRRITAAVSAALGVPGGGGAGVEARLYKLLVYERGGHFKAHRDTEKEPGMFATLLVQLPVAGGHTGGRLTISHLGQKKEWDTAAAGEPTAAAGVRYAAFYADCEHELSAVQTGRRVVLAYNLVRPQAAAAAHMTGPLASFSCNMAPAADAVTAAVRAWEAEGGAADPVVAVPLAHKYTETNLGFGALKGCDAAKVQLLVACPLLDVHLVLITKEVIGSTTTGAYYGKRSRHRWDDYESEGEADHETLARTAHMDDVIDENIDTGIWVSPLFGRLGDPYRSSGIHLPLEDGLLGGQELFPNGLQPDRREYEGYTGNAGPELRYFYHAAVVVAWPRSRRSLLPYAPDSAAAALELAQQRLKHLQAGGAGPVPGDASSSGQSWGHRHRRDPAALQQLLGRVERVQPHELDTQGLSRVEWEAKQAAEAAVGWALRAGSGGKARSKAALWGAAADKDAGASALLPALRLVTTPQVALLCGEEWRAQAGGRLLQALAGAANASVNMNDAGLQAAIAAAASSMASSVSFVDAVMDLVARQAARQLTGCYGLAMQAEMPAPLRDRMLRAICAAVFGVEAAATPMAPVTAATSAAPVAAAASSGIAQLQAADVCFLARVIFTPADAGSSAAAGACGSSSPFSGLGGAFASEVLRRGDCQALLRLLLQGPPLQQALHRLDTHALRLAEARVQYLQPRAAAGVPRPDFSLPHVAYPEPKVAAFLHDASQTHTFGGFTSISEARRFAEQHFSAQVQQRYGFHAQASPSGQGRSSIVYVAKSRDLYDQRVATYHHEVKELAEVRGMLAAAAAVGTEAGAAGAAGFTLPPAPRHEPAGPPAQGAPLPAAAAALQQVQPRVPMMPGAMAKAAARVAAACGSGQHSGGVMWAAGGSAQGLVPPQQQHPASLAANPSIVPAAATAAAMVAWAQAQPVQHQHRIQAGGSAGAAEVVDLTND